MSPITHFLASWLVAAKMTESSRTCRLVTLAGVAPDLDGLGLVADVVANAVNHTQSFYHYQRYHHYWLHGIAGALVIATLLAVLARERWRVFLFALLAIHLHLLCDLLGSRGPEAGDFWPIYYIGPFAHHPVWLWQGQWRLDAWPNQLISLVLLLCALRVALVRGESFVGVINRRVDAVFISTLRRWRDALAAKQRCNGA